MHQKGPSYPFIFDCLVGRLNLEKNLVAGMVRVFIDHEPEINCFDGVLEMLSRMSERYRLGILTDGRFSVQRKKIINLGLVEKVDIYLCSDAMGLEKPASMLFQWFESKFGLDGRRLLYVGDNPKKDFIGARTRGWNTIRVLWGEYKKYKTDKEYEADIQVESVSELTYLLSADKINQIPALIDLSGERRL